MKTFSVALLTAGSLFIANAAPAQSAVVTFTGTVLNTCVLTVSTPGTLGPSADGTRLSSEDTGGLAAVLAVVSTGTAPTLAFTAPAMTGPTGWSGSPVVSMKYSSLSGSTQAFTTASSSVHLTALLDTLTVNAKAVNSTGFASGAYQIASTVTCQQ